MKHSRFHRAVALGLALSLLPSVPSQAADADETTYDGLVRTKVKRIDEVYLLPGADFSVYTKIMIEPVDVSFRRNWQRDHNGMSGRVTDSQARDVLDEASTAFAQIIRSAFEKHGFVVVDKPGSDVLKVRPAISDLVIYAPDVQTAARVRTYSREAGEATLVVEARDSLSGQLLGRTIDTDTAGDFGSYMRNSVTNRSDFERLFRQWAEQCAKGLVKLRSSTTGAPAPAVAQ